MQTKELLKLLVVIYTLICSRTKRPPSVFKPVIQHFVLTPLLALVGSKESFSEDIINYEPRARDSLIALVLDEILGGVNQIALVLYFTVVVNKTGLSIANYISLSMNALSLLMKILQMPLLFWKEHKEHRITKMKTSAISVTGNKDETVSNPIEGNDRTNDMAGGGATKAIEMKGL
jgi:hypothetical protein